MERVQLAVVPGVPIPLGYAVDAAAGTITLAESVGIPIATFDLQAIVPDLTVFSAETDVSGRVRTADAAPADAYRLSLPALTGAAGIVTVIGVDAGNGAVRMIRASFAVKRLNGGALAVGSPVVLASHADTGTTTWQIG